MGDRRVGVYVSWSYPGEAQAPLHELDNRFSTIFEVRRVSWPKFESQADPSKNLQGIDGTLELFFRDWETFLETTTAASGNPVRLTQRVDQRGVFCPLDERILDGLDTLIVFSLDHQKTQQAPSDGEIDAIRAFAAREGKRLIIGPHHDIGATDDLAARQAEYLHHGDELVPRQQRFGTFGLSLLRALDVPVENRYGLHPAPDPGGKTPVPLTLARELDKHGLMDGVTTLTLHAHLPHYAVMDGAKNVHVLASQKIDPNAPPHPFIDAGNTEINVVVWAPPDDKRAADVLVVDSTQFTGSLFGFSESMRRFWHNLAVW